MKLHLASVKTRKKAATLGRIEDECNVNPPTSNLVQVNTYFAYEKPNIDSQ